MSKWKIGLYLVALFLAGVVTGGILTAAVGRQIMARVMRPEAMATHWQKDLEKRLTLDPEQSQKIGVIIMDAIGNFGSVLSGQTQLALSNCNARIETELTAEQKVKFAEIEKDQQAFIQSRFKEMSAKK